MEQFGGYIIPIIIIIVVVVIVAISKYKQNKYKSEVTSKIIKEMFPDADYRPAEHITKAEYDDIGLRRGSYFEGSDLLYATTKGGRKFRFSEINTYDRTHTDKSSTTVTIFKGGIFSFEYPKKFSSPVAIQKKGFNAAGSLKTWGEHKIETENVAFNKKFRVHAKDDETAFYICTPKFMDKMLSFAETYKKGLLLSFKDNWVHIAIPTLDMFKAPLFGSRKPEKIAKFSQRSKDDLDRIDQFIENLEIDSRMFTG